MLARKGASVVVLEKDGPGSDQLISTHTIHPPGMDVLDELGVGDEVRRLSPASRLVRLQKNDAVLDIEHADGRADYCPRRARLDQSLQQAAMDAGAEVIPHTRVTGVILEGDRVAGVKATKDGIEHDFRANLVVGADGRHSTIARLVQAEEYLGYDAPRGTYWSYWNAPAIWHDEERFPFDMYVGNRKGVVRLIFQTDNDQLLIGSAPGLATCREWRHDPLAALTADLASDPLTGPLIEGQQPTERVRGTIAERFFFRRGAGPGWALVGDAGHHKDYVIGDGITEALLQARDLTKAIDSGTDKALQAWWRARDVAALPLFYFAEDEARLGPPLQMQVEMFQQVGARPDLRQAMARVMEHELSPYEMIPPLQLVKWTMSAALHGKFAVVPEFLSMGKRATAIGRELQHRKQLLKELQ
jgi:flavin-dependent dehydrogenase